MVVEDDDNNNNIVVGSGGSEVDLLGFSSKYIFHSVRQNIARIHSSGSPSQIQKEDSSYLDWCLE